MDQTSAALPILRVQQLPAYQSGGQQQTPFSQGQMLHGMISEHTSTGQFAIDIGGHRVLAESVTPLQVGERLDLQVTALTPRVELQIVRNPIHRMIGTTIHLIGQQATTLTALTSLADQSTHLPGLSGIARETLQFFATFVDRPTPVDGSPSGHTLSQLLGRTTALLTSAPGSAQNALFTEISTLLHQLAKGATLAPEHAARAAALATLFTNLPARPSMDQPLLPVGTGPAPLPFLASAGTIESAPLSQLVTLLAGLESSGATTGQPPITDGSQLQEVLDRLGVNMERLLAEGRQEEAVRTLKFALLELGQQLPAVERGAMQADQLVSSIELFQFLQIRLASESLFFLPLPFSFLDQGYLLVDTEQGRGQYREAGEKENQRYELHLRLEGLGNLQISIQQIEGRLSVRFLAEDVERARFLADSRGELAHHLSGAELASVQFLVGAREPVTSLLEKIVGGVTGMVNTQA